MKKWMFVVVASLFVFVAACEKQNEQRMVKQRHFQHSPAAMHAGPCFPMQAPRQFRQPMYRHSHRQPMNKQFQSRGNQPRHFGARPCRNFFRGEQRFGPQQRSWNKNFQRSEMNRDRELRKDKEMNRDRNKSERKPRRSQS